MSSTYTSPILEPRSSWTLPGEHRWSVVSFTTILQNEKGERFILTGRNEEPPVMFRADGQGAPVPLKPAAGDGL